MLNPSGDSPEIVALALLERIARAEGKHFDVRPDAGTTTADRLWILDTYSQCLAAVQGVGMASKGRQPVTQAVGAR